MPVLTVKSTVAVQRITLGPLRVRRVTTFVAPRCRTSLRFAAELITTNCMRLYGGAQRRTDQGRDGAAAGTTVAFHPAGDTATQLRRVESRLRAVAATPDE